MLVRARNRIDAELARTARRAELRAGPRTRRGEVHGLLAARAPAALPCSGESDRPERTRPGAAAGRRRTPAPTGMVTAEQVSVIAPVTRPENVVAAAEQGVDLAGGRRSAGRGRRDPAARRTWARSCTTTFPGSTPTARNPTPPRAGRCRSPEARRRQPHRPRRNSMPWAGRSSQAAAGIDPCRPTGPPVTPEPVRSSLPTPSSKLADNALASGTPPVPADRQTARVRHHRHRRPRRPRHPAPAPAETGFGAAHLRRPGPLAGLRRQRHPHRHRPRRPTAGHGPRPSASSHRTSAGPSSIRDRHCVFAGCHAPTHWCDVHHLFSNGCSTTARPALENGALLCERHHTKVHHGFRVERQPRRPMAHLPPRRHRDPLHR